MYSPRDWVQVGTVSLSVVVAPTTADQYIVVGGPTLPWIAPPPQWACNADYLVGVEMSPTLLDPGAGLVEQEGTAVTPSYPATPRDPMRVEWSFETLPNDIISPFGAFKGQNVLINWQAAEFWWDQSPIRRLLQPLPGPDWWRLLQMRVLAQGSAQARAGYVHLHVGVSRGL